ncbi:hypothetical protein [Streptomyces sp. NPDC015131]|uniref:hypothetical protein n=1 Tax=Streptomyces sp. NPDC015131 TaxID=3364941 RepID=UPI0037031FBD
MNTSRPARPATRALVLTLTALAALAVPATAHAAPAAYSPQCRSDVAEGRAFLTKLGRNPHTNDPKVVLQKLDEVFPLIAGQPAQLAARIRADIVRSCFA